MSKEKRRKVIFLLLTVTWMAFIFYMSSKDADTSTGYSLKVGETVGEFIIPGFGKMSELERTEFAKLIDAPVRKSAHFFEYSVLGILTLLAFGKFWASFSVSALYAVSDEIHQLYVPGRSCELKDVIIDVSGVLFGIAVIFLIRKIKRNKV